jgi:hypothetical protein
LVKDFLYFTVLHDQIGVARAPATLFFHSGDDCGAQAHVRYLTDAGATSK